MRHMATGSWAALAVLASISAQAQERMLEPALERELIGRTATDGHLSGGRSGPLTIRTVKDFEAAIAANRAGAPVLRGTTGSRLVDYSSVLEDARV